MAQRMVRFSDLNNKIIDDAVVRIVHRVMGWVQGWQMAGYRTAQRIPGPKRRRHG